MSDIKHILEEFFASFEDSYREPTVILKDMAGDGEWWVAGRSPMSGRWSKAEMLQHLEGLQEITRDGMHFKPVGWLIGDDKAAVEVEGRMSLTDGREYKNDYHFVFEFENGKISKIREYMDTGYVISIFGTAPEPLIS
jgi:hypothetical protein